MNIGTISRLVLAMGSTILVYALFIMDVTADGRIVNLNLLNIRQNLVIVGALMVLVGTILLATSILAGKVKVNEGTPEVVSPPRPNPLLKLLMYSKDRVKAWLRKLNDWRPRFFFRSSFALICSINLAMVFPVLPWQPYAIGLAIFLPLSMRKLPPKIAVSKTCFWAMAITLPLNIAFLLSAFSNMDLPLLLAMRNVVTTLILAGFYVKYSSN